MEACYQRDSNFFRNVLSGSFLSLSEKWVINSWIQLLSYVIKLLQCPPPGCSFPLFHVNEFVYFFLSLQVYSRELWESRRGIPLWPTLENVKIALGINNLYSRHLSCLPSVTWPYSVMQEAFTSTGIFCLSFYLPPNSCSLAGHINFRLRILLWSFHLAFQNHQNHVTQKLGHHISIVIKKSRRIMADFQRNVWGG